MSDSTYCRAVPDTSARPGSGHGEDQVIILIHGTFAASESDEGSSWWQADSAFSNALIAELPDGFAVDINFIFHWSGSNLASERIKGARSLADKIIELERSNRCYHLIAHSHGGSLVWECLKMITLNPLYFAKIGRLELRPKLRGLKSWATVGTPFIRLCPTNTRGISGYFFSFLKVAGAGSMIFVVIIGFMSYLAAFSESSDVRFGPAAMIAIPLIMLAVLMMSVSMLVALNQIESINKELEAENKVLELYGESWLGIWSTDDEAINGLKVVRNLGGEIIPRKVSHDPVFYAPKYKLLYWPRKLLVDPVAGVARRFFVAPLGDRYIWAQMKRSLFGNDRPGADVLSVLSAPNPRMEACPPLPPEICSRLCQNANEQASRYPSQMRLLLGSSVLTGGLSSFVPKNLITFSGSELVHTSYFGDPSVRSLLLQHILASSDMSQRQYAGISEFDLNWMRDFSTTRDACLGQSNEVSKIFEPVARLLLVIFFVCWIAFFCYLTLG